MSVCLFLSVVCCLLSNLVLVCCLKAFVEADCGRWLGILLRESGYGAQLVGSHRNSTAEMDAMDTEGIYDEVYNWEVYDIGGKMIISSTSVFPFVFPAITDVIIGLPFHFLTVLHEQQCVF